MAETSALSEIGSNLVSKIFGSIIWFAVIFICIVIVGGSMYYFIFYRRKFDIKVKIISNRAEDKDSIIFDKAAILNELKSKEPYFKVWGLKRDFPVPKYNVLQRTNQGDYLEIYRKSENEFYFLTPSKINNEHIIMEDGKSYALADQIQFMVDPEMGFWLTKRKDKNKKMFDTEKFWMKLLPYIPHILAGVIIIFILYILLDHLPGILSNLSKLAESMAQMKAAEVTTG